MAAEQEQIDVLIVTAVKEEYDAVLQVDTSAVPGSAWEPSAGPTDLEVAFRSFRAKGGWPLRIAVTRALDMGGMGAANAAAPLVHAYRPRCLAMCGVCGGRRGKVNLGDVIIADRMWTYDTGKRVGGAGEAAQHFRADPQQYQIRPAARNC